MPSSPESGPIMIWTLSCSTAFLVIATALSGVASDETLTNSIFLPPAMPFFSFSAMSAPRRPQPRRQPCESKVSSLLSLWSPLLVGNLGPSQAGAKLRPQPEQTVGGKQDDGEAVSYTHLTLPTSDLV